MRPIGSIDTMQSSCRTVASEQAEARAALRLQAIRLRPAEIGRSEAEDLLQCRLLLEKNAAALSPQTDSARQ